MLKILKTTLVLLFAQNLYAQDMVRIVTSKENDKGVRTVLKSTLKENKYTFEMCSEKSELMSEISATNQSVTQNTSLYNCRQLGRAEGYSQKQIMERLDQLKGHAFMDKVYDIAAVGLGVVAGGFVGLGAGYLAGEMAFARFGTWSSQHMRNDVIAAIPYVGIAGGAIGGGILANYLVWGSDAQNQLDVLKASLGQNEDDISVLRIELEDVDMLSAIREVNISLAGMM